MHLLSGMASFQFPGQTGFYRGKVRDVYTIKDDLLVMIASDRISAFDVILPPPHSFQRPGIEPAGGLHAGSYP
jgi:hypothetical protein